MKLSFYLVLVSLLIQGLAQPAADLRFFGDPEIITRLNSPFDENYLSFHPEGNEIIFTRRNHPGNVGGRHNPGDLWISVFDSTWSSPRPTVNVHPTKFVTPIGYVNGGEYFLYSTTAFDRGVFKGEIWIGKIKAGKIEGAGKIDMDYFINVSEHQSGFISADGKHILLSMEANFSFGVEDIYVSHLKSDGSWSSPRNLGYRINTSFQEYTPFLAADGKTLVFASNGHADGFGSFDLYSSQRVDDSWQNWTEPVNLGPRINTGGSETSFNFLPGSEHAYFVSTQDSDGYGDIKRIKIQTEIKEINPPETAFVLKEETPEKMKIFRLVDRVTRALVNGSITLTGENLDMEVSSGDSIEELLMTDMVASTKAPGFLDHQVRITELQIQNNDTIDIVVDALSVGNTIQLENVLFYRGTANFVEGSQSELDVIVEMMKEYPALKILIKGHTDNVGDPTLNLELSKERVYVVRDYLMSKGVDFRRLQSQGFGGNQPMVPNDSEENRQLNRRVEFTIIQN